MKRTYGKLGLLLLILAGMAVAQGDKPAFTAETGWGATGWYVQIPAYQPAPAMAKPALELAQSVPGPTALLEWKGILCGEITRTNGAVEDLGCNHNMIVNGGKDMAIGDIFGLTAQGTANVWNQLAVGQNVTPFAATDTALSGIYTNCGLGIATATLTRVGVGNVSSVYTWTSSCDAKTITAGALYNATNSVLAAEGTVTSGTLNTGDKYTLTYYGGQT